MWCYKKNVNFFVQNTKREKLIESFERLQSIGHKTAARLAFHILNSSEEETNEFINSIQNAKKNLKYCSKCYNISDTDPCPLCANVKRDKEIICVVKEPKDVVAMENALRIYNGKALINSVNGKKESMKAIFPLVKKYGGVVVALTLDENGIPKKSEERFKIAEKMHSKASLYFSATFLRFSIALSTCFKFKSP